MDERTLRQMRDHQIDLDAILDHLGTCLIIARDYPTISLCSHIEKAIVVAQAECDNPAPKAIN